MYTNNPKWSQKKCSIYHKYKKNRKNKNKKNAIDISITQLMVGKQWVKR